MAWSPDFHARLRDSNYAPRMLLQTIQPPERIGYGTFTLTTHNEVGGLPIIGTRGFRSAGQQVTPGSWASAPGTWSIPLVGDLQQIRTRIWRGMLVKLMIGFQGQALDEFTPVALGQVWALGGRPGAFTLQMRDMVASLGSRFTRTSNEYALFHDVATTTTVKTGVNYVAAAVTLDLTSVAGFQRQDDTSGALKGCVKVTPDSGSDFYLTYTGVTGTQLTGVSTTGQFGTSAGNAAAGNAVVEVAYIDDTPIKMAQRVLVSTGTANANTNADRLPKSWGYGLDGALVDITDMAFWDRYTKAGSGSADWDFVIPAAQANGLTWLNSVLQPGGFWLTQRQGRLTCRGAIHPDAGSAAASKTGVPIAGVISNDDLRADAPIQWDAFDPAYGTEYRRAKITSDGGSTTLDEAITSHPAQFEREYNVSATVFSNETNQRSLLRDRLGPWALRIPERLTIPCKNLRHAALTTGDIIELQIDLLGGRLDTTTGGFKGRRAMVTRVSPNWWAGNATVQAAVRPNTDDEFA